MQITDKNGTSVARYDYDAWGKCAVTYDSTASEDFVGIATVNPIRYRSYYFDADSGLYYLQSRYYSPEFGRFISSDDVRYIVEDELNLYRYCFNNPVQFSDPTGTCGGGFFPPSPSGVSLAISATSQFVIKGFNAVARIFGPPKVTSTELDDGKVFVEAKSPPSAKNPNGITASKEYNVKPYNPNIPNPYGKTGCNNHDITIEWTRNGIESYGYTQINTETPVKTPGGFKESRYIDVTAFNPSTNKNVGVNVGRVTKSGQPVARESRALSDIALSGEYSEIYFVEYYRDKK